MKSKCLSLIASLISLTLVSCSSYNAEDVILLQNKRIHELEQQLKTTSAPVPNTANIRYKYATAKEAFVAEYSSDGDWWAQHEGEFTRGFNAGRNGYQREPIGYGQGSGVLFGGAPDYQEGYDAAKLLKD
jgi:hypothetical protein